MGDFDWKIWFQKVGKKALFGAVIGGLTELAAALGTEPVPSEYVWITALAILGIEAILNAIKHSLPEK